MLLMTTCALAAGTQARVPALPVGAVDLGVLPGSQPVRVTLYVAPGSDRQAALVEYLKDVATPGNAAYHAWLTPVEFGQRFGATVEQLAAIDTFAQGAGFSEELSASGLRVTLSGTVAQMEAVFAPGLHGVSLAGKTYFANTAAPTLPAALAGDVLAVGGLENLPAAYPMSLVWDGGARTAEDALAGIGKIVEANETRLLSLSTASCLEDVDAATQAAMQLALRQATAQGITVLAETGCGARGSAGFPSVLSEVTSVAIAPGIVPATYPAIYEERPSWQVAIGLPADGYRHEPDVTVSSLSALTATMEAILAKAPAGANGEPGRLGNINTTLYELGPIAGLYMQPDHAAPDTWEAATGLGLVDLGMLGKIYPLGSLSVNVSCSLTSYFVASGSPINFTSTVTDTSGKGGGVTPTGTVTFTTNTGVTLGSGQLSNGTVSGANSSLAAGSYTMTAAYSGDGTYDAWTSNAINFTIGSATSSLSAVASSGAVVGGNITVTVTDTGVSGQGVPTGSVQVTPQGTNDNSTYTGTLTASGAITSTATVAVPATQGGSVTLQVNCTSTNSSYTCFSPVNATATVGLGTPTMTVTTSPNPTVANQNTTFTATVTAPAGAKYPVPTGNVSFFNGSTQLPSATLSAGVASMQTSSNITAGGTYTATYGGDNNYKTVTATTGSSGTASNTITSITVSPNPPVTGSTTTLTGVVGYTLTNGTLPTGTMSFYVNGALAGSGTVSTTTPITATFTTTSLNGSVTNTFYAVYSGDSNYLTSTSTTTTTTPPSGVLVPTTLTLGENPNPPVLGSTTLLSSQVNWKVATTTPPTGTVTYFMDGAALGTGTVNSLNVSQYSTTTISGTTSHTFFAVYTGDSNYAASTSPTVTTTGSGIVTTTALTVSPNPPVGGSTTTLTAVIAYTSSGTTPTGTMSFYEDGALLGSDAVTGGTTYTFTSTTITGTTAHSFYAVYSGDTNFNASTSPVVATSASSATVTTTATLTVSPNPPVSGSTTTLTATIAYSSTSTPTGTVTFYEDGASLGSATLSGGTASFSSTILSSKTAHAFYAVYSGDATFKASTSPTVTTAAAAAAATTTTMTISPNPPVAGSLTTLMATIGYTGTTVPTGTVGFYEDGTLLTSGTLTNGVATLTSTAFSSKTAHTFYGTYSGDTNYAASTSPTVTTVASATTPTSTTTGITAASYTVTSGATDALTATVTPSSVVNSTNPTGTVTFTSSTQGTLCTGTVSSGAATCTPTLTTVGSQSITATYSGDSNYATSTSALPAVVAVAAAVGTGTITASASPSTALYGVTVTLGSTLSETGGTGAPAGSATFALAGTVSSTYTASYVTTSATTAAASQQIPTPSPGTYVVTATCTSSNVTCTGLSATASLTVAKGNTLTTVVASPTSPVAGQTTVFTVTVAPAYTVNTAATLPTGSVTIYINGTSTVVPVVNGTATYAVVLTATTGNYVTAVYTGDTNWNGSSSAQLIVTIQPVPTNISLTSNATTALYTANIVLTATISVAPTTLTPVPLSPTGTVTFYDLYNGLPSLVGTANVTQLVLGYSIAEISTTGLLKGTHNITAVYNGTTAYASSTATIVINITDYGYTFAPATMSLTRGTGAAAVATITSYNGFAGQVVLGCTPPPGALMTCSFSPAVISASGTSVLSVTTTAATASLGRPAPMGTGGRISLAAVSLATLMLGLSLRGRRRKVSWLLALAAAIVLGGSAGCVQQSTVSSGSSSSGTGGTPQGTQLLTITTDGTDGLTTLRIDSNYQVTVQ